MFRAVILDFDGVILESCNIKTVAFGRLFQDFPEHVDKLLNYHIDNMGISRYKKFEYFYKNLLNMPIDDEKLEELGKRFSDLVMDEIKECQIVPGALEFLKNHSKKMKLYVASGTPEPELRAIVKQRGLETFFKGVFGTPSTKSEIISKILEDENLKKDEVVFIGDSTTDYKEAMKIPVPFIYRTSESPRFTPKNDHCMGIIPDLKSLDELLKY
jgi:HAD superfamily hydrolase (TIGR01549 family)